jgi:hypothetical protein
MVESEDNFIDPPNHQQKSQSHQSTGPTIASNGGHIPPALPQVLINSVKDENVRNLMMSWYWAGYYTGLHEGQQSSKIE